MFNIDTIRQQFPILSRKVHGKPLVYLDSAATSQKPKKVIDAVSDYYLNHNANVERGVYELAQEAESLFEGAREKVRQFLNAKKKCEIIFIPNATFGINLVANSLGKMLLQAGDHVLISEMEHHSNLIPWQIICKELGAILDVIPVFDDGTLDLSAYKKLLTPRTKILALTHVSNVLGTINPLQEMIALAHTHGVKVLVDGSQAVAHLAVDVQKLDCDFYVFTGHKFYAPTGSGALYGKEELLQNMSPYQSGGGMVQTVDFDNTVYADLPHKFEAGTPNISSAIGLGAAIDFVNEIGMENITRHDKELISYAMELLPKVPKIKILGNAKDRITAISFIFSDIHPHDIATILDAEGIAVRGGNHCARPLMLHYGVEASTRASFAVYNTKQEIDALFAGLLAVRKIFGN